MVRFLILPIFFAALISGNASAQNIPPIQTDRPDQTECAFTVPKNYIQIENGLSIEKTNHSSQNIYWPSTLWKYGINDRLEFRLITELVSEKVNNQAYSGLNPVTIGFKVNLFESKGVLPLISFIGHLTTSNIGSKQFHTTYYAPSFKFAMQNTLSDKMALGYNLGAQWDGETPEPTFIYSLTTGRSITEKLGAYVELYGYLPQKSISDHRLDGGLTYFINNNLMIDFSSGLGLTENAPDYYIGLGLSFRFKTTGE